MTERDTTGWGTGTAGPSGEPSEKPFRTIVLTGTCPDCGNPETMAVGDEIVDEKCTRCGRIVGGGYVAGPSGDVRADGGGESEGVINRFDVSWIRECARCGDTGDDSEEYGVRGIARIGGNLCVECVRELHTATEEDP